MRNSKRAIRVLVLEDNPPDAELEIAQLESAGFAPDWVRVMTGPEFAAQLDAKFDVILADYSLPQFSAIGALQVMQQRGCEIPLIVVSGSIGEERAAECIKEGATDYLLKDRLGRLGRAVAVAIEHHELKLARRAAAEGLERERALLRTLIDNIPDAVYVKDDESRFLLANSALARLAGTRQPSDLIGRTDADFFPSRHADGFRADEQRVLAGQPLLNQEETLPAADGTRRVLLTTKLPLPDREGRITRLVGIDRDITDRKQAEEQRRASEARFAAIFHSSPVAISYSTRDGRLLDVNDEWCEFFGYKRDEAVGRSANELGLWANADERPVVMKKLFAERSVRNHEVRFRRKSGDVRTALFSLDLLQFGAEQVMLATIVDITDRKTLEAELHRAQRVECLGRLASGIAHDMNNILAPIMMAAPLLRMKLTPAEVEKTLSTIETSAQRGASLVRQLLIFGRGVEGERRPVDPRELVNELAKILRQTFPRNITIETEVRKNVRAVVGDSTQLHQVLLNLCVNARDAMPDGGVLVLGAENVDIDATFASFHTDAQPGRYVTFRVSDSGTGIAPENLEHIFEPFFTTKEIGQGTGLGLSTVRGIVKGHGGFVRLRSEVGQGTTFEIFVPAAEGVVAVTSTTTGTSAPRGNGECILVVDDEELVRSMLRETLVRHNYKVMTAPDGMEATAVFASNVDSVKLVITDLDMPLLDGVNLARVLRRMRPDVKIIVSTGVSGRSGAARRSNDLDEIGVDAILTKPYSAEQILTEVHDALVAKAR
jgi:PAS domain S-box-containing protein